MSEGPTSPIRIRTALLADFAKVEQSGLLSIVGGGISDIRVSALPSQLSLGVVLQLLRQDAAAGVLTLEVRRPTGDSAFTINGELSLDAGRLANVAFNLSLLIDAPGDWTVVISVGDGQPPVELPLTVALGQASE